MSYLALLIGILVALYIVKEIMESVIRAILGFLKLIIPLMLMVVLVIFFVVGVGRQPSGDGPARRPAPEAAPPALPDEDTAHPDSPLRVELRNFRSPGAGEVAPREGEIRVVGEELFIDLDE